MIRMDDIVDLTTVFDDLKAKLADRIHDKDMRREHLSELKRELQSEGRELQRLREVLTALRTDAPEAIASKKDQLTKEKEAEKHLKRDSKYWSCTVNLIRTVFHLELNVDLDDPTKVTFVSVLGENSDVQNVPLRDDPTAEEVEVLWESMERMFCKDKQSEAKPA